MMETCGNLHRTSGPSNFNLRSSHIFNILLNVSQFSNILFSSDSVDVPVVFNSCLLLFAPLEVSFPHCRNLVVPGKLKNLQKLAATQISAIFVFTFSF